MVRAVICLLVLSHAAALANAATCDERMTQLEQRLESICRYTPVGFDLKLAIPSARGMPVTEVGWAIEVDAGGKASLSGEPDSSARLADQIAVRLESRRVDWHGQPVYLAAQPGTSVKAVHAAVAEARRAGLRGEARVLVEGPPPPAASTDAELLSRPTVAALNTSVKGKDVATRATALSEALRTAIFPCAPILKVFGAAANDEPSKKSIRLIEAAPAARECRCRMADLDVFEFAMLSYCEAFERRMHWLPVPPNRGTRTMGQAVGGSPSR